MKYIRTKDGRIVKVGEGTDIGYELGTFEVHNKAGIVASYEPIEVLKEADTIPELCDVLLFIGQDNVPIILDVELKHAKDRADDLGLTEWAVYGAIWTEWGLKYVAKMNEKGELELL